LNNSVDCKEAEDLVNPRKPKVLDGGVQPLPPAGLAQDSKTGKPIQVCNGTNSNNCVEGEAAAKSQRKQNLGQRPANYSPVTCTDRQQEDCQPTCTESLTRGCTEARTPNWPEKDRFEGKYTHK
jgi:hypothetical protein